AITADGFGGAVMTWFDGRSGARGVYVQRVSDLGVPQWTIDGVALKTASTNQATMPLICADGSGGAIAAWMDNRSGGYDVYVRRVSSAGVAQWTANGVALCTAANDQYFPVPLPDGAGGAFVTWSDFRSGTILNLYAQRVSSAGAPLWTADGILVSTGTTDKSSPTIDTDGAGGAIIAWYETGNGNDVYVQRLNASGAIPSGVFGPARGPSLVAVQAYPNPFATTTAISVELATPAAARVDIYDVAGRNVRTLMLERAASHRFAFDGKDSAHRSLPSGVYFCRIQALGESVTRKLVIAR
ncbi:MAG TPA: T9SS type A sorting domain-containing protein, partial [Candidatus Krumholzibacteria bacterium]|nr:T9SS type A sorting domain-containing protein [Candidatus Krumholzibacteria bacterium]